MKVKLSQYRPGQAICAPGIPIIARQLAREGGKVISPMHRQPLIHYKHSKIYLSECVYFFSEDSVHSERIGFQLSPVTGTYRMNFV